jgi:hypothetical protein
VGATCSEEWLDIPKVNQDHRSFQGSLPIPVRRSAFDSVKDHLSRGAEQDDRVETVSRSPQDGVVAIGVGVTKQHAGHLMGGTEDQDHMDLRVGVLGWCHG